MPLDEKAQNEAGITLQFHEGGTGHGSWPDRWSFTPDGPTSDVARKWLRAHGFEWDPSFHEWWCFSK